MGVCSSHQSSSFVATAKLILEDGQLQEFTYPVRVSYLQQKHSSSFICNSDEMEFEGYLSPMRSNQELQLGQLYFVLPLSKLKRPLQSEEMAALAVKASSALIKTGNKQTIFTCCNPKQCPTLSSDGGVMKKSRANGRGSVHNFTSNLAVITE